jgi:hypothetical protein
MKNVKEHARCPSSKTRRVAGAALIPNAGGDAYVPHFDIAAFVGLRRAQHAVLNLDPDSCIRYVVLEYSPFT